MTLSSAQQPMARTEPVAHEAAWQPTWASQLGSGEARELLVMQAGEPTPLALPQFTVVPPGAELPPPQEASRAGEQKLRQQLITLSMCVAGYLVFSKLLDYLLTLYLMDDMVAMVHTVLHQMPENPSFRVMAFTGLPNMWAQIAVSLLVPLCGYCGAKQNNACLVGTFSCCSGVTCCCGSFGMVLLLLLVVGMEGFAPQAEAWMVKCDPYICLPKGNQTRQKNLVDCLAAGIWEREYARSFPGEPAYPSVCAKAGVWLRCDGEAAPVSAPSAPEVVDSRRLLDLRGSHFASTATHWQRHPPPSHRGPPRMPMPANVLRDCLPDTEKMHTWHAASLVVPEVVPKVVFVLALQVALVLPAILLGCLGTIWGLRVYGLTQTQLFYPPNIAVQPALGTVVQSAGGVAEPLMLSSGPSS